MKFVKAPFPPPVTNHPEVTFLPEVTILPEVPIPPEFTNVPEVTNIPDVTNPTEVTIPQELPQMFCNASFLAGQRAKHLTTHTPERGYSCRFCTLSCPDCKALKSHIASKHGETNEGLKLWKQLYIIFLLIVYSIYNNQ